MRKSRLNKYNESRNKKTTILSIIGIVIILFLVLKFGLGILVSFSVFLSGGGNQNNNFQASNQINFIAPPLLNPIVTATNSANIIISGKTDKNNTVYLYINGAIVDHAQTQDNGTFNFSETLNKGSNQIYAVAEYKNKRSESSDSFTVYFSNSQPALDVSAPSDGQSFNKDQNTVNVAGKTDPGVKVTVNGFWAVIDDNNNFSYTLPLQNGDNQIKILATDQAGNQNEKDLKVTYSQ
jgi:hypothetical protein